MIWNFCIRRPVMTIVIFLVLGIFGAYGYMRMPVQENPDVDFPVVSVNVVLPGAAPGIIETEVLDPIESEINTIEGLRQLNSTAREQVASIVAEFELWRDIDIATQDVRDAVERARRRLPTDIESPIVRKLDISAQAIMWIALTGDQRWDDVRLTDYAENVVKRRIETLRGVGQIWVGGRRQYAVRVRLDPERLAAHQLTVQDVVQTIRENNVDIPSGRIEGARREFLIQTRGQFSEAAPFNELIVVYRNGSPVRLADVGQAVDHVEDDRQLARFRGIPSVGLGIIKQADANTVEVAQLIRTRIAEIAEDFPPGLTYRISTDTSIFVKESINDLLLTIMIATLLVVLVVLGFLRSWRGTIVTIIAIPTSLLIGVAVINILGFSINVLTMLALILVIGIVIDDAIVVLERAYLHMENGAESAPAARIGTTEVAFPAIANTLALAAVFIPVAFTGGMVGRFFMEFGLTVAVTVFASTFVALTLTPMLCSRLLRVPESHGRLFRWSERVFTSAESGYRRLLATAFRHRGLTILVGMFAFGIGLLALLNLPREFAPMEDRSAFLLIFETPQGATLPETNDFAKQIEAVLADTPEVRHQFLAIGLQMGGPGQANRGRAFVRLYPRQERERHQALVMQELRQRLNALPSGRAFITEMTPGQMGGSPVEFVLKHTSMDELASQQEVVMQWMESQPRHYVGVRTNLELNNPQVSVRIDRDRASELGVSAADIANTLRFFFAAPAISTIERDAHRYDVVMDVAGRGHLTPRVLGDLYVRGGNGALVALDNVVEIEETIGPSQINRHNRMRSATISSHVPPGVAVSESVSRLEDHLRATLPTGFDYERTGMSQLYAESFYYLAITIVFAIIFIYLVLAAQFESFIYPLSIMVSLPLALVGAFGALWVMGLAFNVYAFIGLIMLMGLVTKNAILLVDYSNVLVGRGLPVVQAAQEAARVRFRPVVMTAVSTMLGMMPIAFGFGAGGESRMPLGISVAAGLFTSTFLTLLVVPVAYTLFDRLQQAILRGFRRQGAVEQFAPVVREAEATT